MRGSTIESDRPRGRRRRVIADNIALDEAKRALLEEKMHTQADHIAQRPTSVLR